MLRFDLTVEPAKHSAEELEIISGWFWRSPGIWNHCV